MKCEFCKKQKGILPNVKPDYLVCLNKDCRDYQMITIGIYAKRNRI